MGDNRAMSDSATTRRSFLTTTIATAAAASTAALATARPTPLAAARPNRVLGANDRINLGFIGVGGRGRGHLRDVMERSQDKADVQVVAVCDIYSKRKTIAREIAGVEAKNVYHEYREILARDDVDAVVISTPDHWHAPQALAALDAGKDVYLEKPMTYTLYQAQELAKGVKIHKGGLASRQPASLGPALPPRPRDYREGLDRQAAMDAELLFPQLAPR